MVLNNADSIYIGARDASEVYSGALLVWPNGNPDDFIWVLEDNNEVTLLNYLGHDAKVIVPGRIERHNVTKVASTTFSYNEDVEEVKLPSKIKEIE